MVPVLVAALLTGLATSVGALPVMALPPLGRRAYDSLLGLGAGLMLAAATLGLLSTALEGVHVGGALQWDILGLVVGGFLGGTALLYLMDRLIPHEHAQGHHDHVHADDPASTEAHPHSHAGHAHHHGLTDAPTARKQGLLVVGVMSLHRLPEGFAIGAAYASGASSALGLTLASALAIQNFVEGGVMAAPLRRGGLSRLDLLLLVTATAIVVPVGALGGYLLASRVAAALPFMLALAGGALIYLTCNEVIPESHSHGHEVPATFGIVAGFVLMILMRAVFNHAD